MCQDDSEAVSESELVDDLSEELSESDEDAEERLSSKDKDATGFEQKTYVCYSLSDSTSDEVTVLLKL